MLRPWTERTGMTASVAIMKGTIEISCWRRADKYHRTSVLLAFSYNQINNKLTRPVETCLDVSHGGTQGVTVLTPIDFCLHVSVLNFQVLYRMRFFELVAVHYRWIVKKVFTALYSRTDLMSIDNIGAVRFITVVVG